MLAANESFPRQSTRARREAIRLDVHRTVGRMEAREAPALFDALGRLFALYINGPGGCDDSPADVEATVRALLDLE